MKILNHAFRSVFVNLRLLIIIFEAFVFVFVPKMLSFFVDDGIRFRKFKIFWQMVFCKLMLFLVGVKVVLRNKESFFNRKRNCLIVSNHQCYLDVITLASLSPMVFVSNTEVEKTKGLGLVTWAGGSIFVDRINKRRVVRDIEMISSLLENGFDVVLFPEGTTSDGRKMLPFKAPLFKSAIDAKRNIFLVSIVYKNKNDENIGHSIVYHSNESLLKHLKRIISMKDRIIEVNFLGELPYSLGRKELVNKSYSMIKSVFEQD